MWLPDKRCYRKSSCFLFIRFLGGSYGTNTRTLFAVALHSKVVPFHLVAGLTKCRTRLLPPDIVPSTAVMVLLLGQSPAVSRFFGSIALTPSPEQLPPHSAVQPYSQCFSAPQDWPDLGLVPIILHPENVDKVSHASSLITVNSMAMLCALQPAGQQFYQNMLVSTELNLVSLWSIVVLINLHCA